jgi:hypothetical protein
MFANRLGEKVGVRRSYVIPSKTASGSPVVKLDRDKDRTVSDSDPALVIREKSAEGTWSWKPVENVDQFTSFMNKASVSDQRENLGLWEDKKSWVFGKPDGKVQDQEVRSMGSEWDQPKSYDVEKRYDPKNDLNSGYAEHLIKVDSNRVNCKLQQGVTGAITVLEEPMFVGETHIHEAETLWQQPYSGQWHVCTWNTRVERQTPPIQEKPAERIPAYFSGAPASGAAPEASPRRASERILKEVPSVEYASFQ